MTIVSSGVISINSLVGEYGGSSPHSMSEYYKGGGLVGNHTNNPNVPTSGTISLSNFYSANNTPPVTDDEYTDFVAHVSNQTIIKINTWIKGWARSILHSPAVGTTGTDTHFKYGTAHDIYLAGAYVQYASSVYTAEIQIYDDGFRNGSTYDPNIKNHENLNGKTCIVAGVNMGTIGTSWTSPAIQDASLGTVQAATLSTGAASLYNTITHGNTYTVRVY